MKNSYEAKAAFFDEQVHTKWAAQAYGMKEETKLKHLFDITGSPLGLRLLEPGCGTGRLTEVLAAKVGPNGSVVAIDISPAMVIETRRRLNGYENVEILMGAVEEQVGIIGKFHMIICHQVFPHFENPGDALGKLSNMLHSGGRIVISHFISSAEINDVHRKSHTVVANDKIPPKETLQKWCDRLNLAIEAWQDDDEGYLLSVRLNPRKPHAITASSLLKRDRGMKIGQVK
jgi:ubiquinone/menaquinone biosynthesis C-methylase UbiE